MKFFQFSFNSSIVLMFEPITPLFELDPLFRRTFLLALPVKEYSKVSGSTVFSPLEIFTTLAKALPEKYHWDQEEVN